MLDRFKQPKNIFINPLWNTYFNGWQMEVYYINKIYLNIISTSHAREHGHSDGKWDTATRCSRTGIEITSLQCYNPSLERGFIWERCRNFTNFERQHPDWLRHNFKPSFPTTSRKIYCTKRLTRLYDKGEPEHVRSRGVYHHLHHQSQY